MNCSVGECKYRVLAKGFCSTHYKRFMKYGDPLLKQEPRKPINFKVSNSGCFECTSHSKNKNGYAMTCANGKAIGVHRFIYQEMLGEIPKDLVVRHKCDNPSCINPEHLELGTVADNNNDRDKRGRHKPLKGSENGFSKLNENEVIEIKMLLGNKHNKKQIAERYKVSVSTIYAISNKQNWGHLYEQV